MKSGRFQHLHGGPADGGLEGVGAGVGPPEDLSA